jgi:hypothetical protein
MWLGNLPTITISQTFPFIISLGGFSFLVIVSPSPYNFDKRNIMHRYKKDILGYNNAWVEVFISTKD